MRSTLVLGVLAWLGLMPAYAASLAAALAAAIAHDPAYQAALERVNVKTEQLQVSNSRLRPSIGINSSRSQVDQRLRTGASGVLDQRYPSRVDSLVMRQSLYHPQLTAELEQAKIGTQAAQAQLTAAHQALVLRLATAHAAALKEMRKSTLLDGQLALLALRRQAAEKAVILGTGIAAERDEILAQTALTRVEQLKSQQALNLARSELASMTGWTAAELDRLFQSPPPVFPPGSPVTEPLPTWLDKVQQLSPTLQEALMQVDSLSVGVKAAEAVRKPTLDLVAQASKTQGENSFFVTSRAHSQSIGLQLYIPITQGGGEWARQRIALAQLREGQANAEQVKNTLISNTRKAYFLVEELQARVNALQQLEHAVRQTATVNFRAQQAGYKTLIDVVNAEQRLLEVQLETLDVQSNLGLALLQLQAQAALATLH